MTGSEPKSNQKRGAWRRLKHLVRSLLRQGLSRKSLALTLALGVVIGILPTVWGSTLVCALLATALGLNQVAIQLVNYLVYPLQILLFLPFLKLGRHLFGAGELALSFHDLVLGFRQDFSATLTCLGGANLQAVGAWALLAPLLASLLYLIFLGLLGRVPVSAPSVPSDDSAASLSKRCLRRVVRSCN